MKRTVSTFVTLMALMILAACGAPAAGGGTTGSSATAPQAAATLTPAGPGAASTVAADQTSATPAVATTAAPAAGATAGPATSGSASAATTIQLTLQPDSQASYRVREQLARVNLPSDAVGTTKKVSGALVIQSNGQVVSDQSKFVVDLNSLSSDSGMRDNYIKGNTLQTGTYPEATFVPTAVEGLPSPLPTSGNVSFTMTGDLTVRGVTKQVTWDVLAAIANNDLTGTATTAIKFGDFGMTPPTTMMALSVEDNIKLEIKFHMTAATS